ncbi:GSU2403 family nucleotidyltransferase fold protein, partial [Herbivorax sp. ANBcel31]|uniref:GSU2403 family nucleotidyltransferase fold protein n=1 Tax=Herbivorax sp. ANBcel31 TaxID=3069754 RepID=UPI0027B86C7C
HGYIYNEDPLTGVSKFYKSAVIELEFIVREMGKGKIEPYKVDSLNVKAEGLRHLDILCDNSIKLEVNNFSLWIPTPPAYIIHKLIINKNRDIKKEKDIRAIKNLLEYVFNDEGEINQLKNIYYNLSKNNTKKVTAVCKENLIELYPGFNLDK